MCAKRNPADQWSGIDCDKGTATIRRTLHHERAGGGFRLEEAAKTRTVRTVVMPKSTLKALRERKPRQDELMLREATGSRAYVLS